MQAYSYPQPYAYSPFSELHICDNTLCFILRLYTSLIIWANSLQALSLNAAKGMFEVIGAIGQLTLRQS